MKNEGEKAKKKGRNEISDRQKNPRPLVKKKREDTLSIRHLIALFDKHLHSIQGRALAILQVTTPHFVP